MQYLTPPNIMFILGLIGIIVTVYKSLTAPQIQSDKVDIKMEDRLSTLEKVVIEIREKHLTSVEGDIKALNITIQDLAKNVVRLSTIIDERIPKIIK